MNPFQIADDGICSTCSAVATDAEILKCSDCKVKWHGLCGDRAPFCNKSFLGTFGKLKSRNFIFFCDSCLTKRENQEASAITDQIKEIKTAINSLQNEFKEISAKKQDGTIVEPAVNLTNETWADVVGKKRNSTLCIKNGADLKVVENIAVENSIQISNTTVHDKGDLFINMPSKQNRDKLAPLLTNYGVKIENIVEIEGKLPTVSVNDVTCFENNEQFIDKVRKQNPDINVKMENGSTFKVVFTRKSKEGNNKCQVVIRVSEDIRDSMKQSGNRIFLDLTSHRVMDRFYIKRCNRCQQYGHYQADCKNDVTCGFCCSSEHVSADCPSKNLETKEFSCTNCKAHKKDFQGHSSHWIRCPYYLELQAKLKKAIPYYALKN